MHGVCSVGERGEGRQTKLTDDEQKINLGRVLVAMGDRTVMFASELN